MDNWEDGRDETYCTAAEDYQDARQVCETLGIPLHKVNFAAEYRERVFKHFWTVTRRVTHPTRTCSATARSSSKLSWSTRCALVQHTSPRPLRPPHLRTRGRATAEGAGRAKDQSYFLHAIPQAPCSARCSPWASSSRPTPAHWPVKRFRQPCQERQHRHLLHRRAALASSWQYLPAQPGDIVTPEGRVMGRHNDSCTYTLGQRQGIGIGGRGHYRPALVRDGRQRKNDLLVVQGS